MTKPKQPAQVTAGPSPRPFEIVGLQPTDSMPITFDGRTYDLASLSDEDAAYLLGFPDQVPYVKSLSEPTND